VNLKLLLPTLRARRRFVLEAVGRHAPAGAALLDVGCGEADLHAPLLPILRPRGATLIGCDRDPGDVAFAAARATPEPSLRYRVADALDLPFSDASFDLVLCVDVIEHVGAPTALLGELHRVLRPGGHLVLTCPSADFPFTYDPIHRIIGLGRGPGFGARAYGHDWLPTPAELERWLPAAGLDVILRARLTGPLAALTELYWAGLLQRALKVNADNRGQGGGRGLRPGEGEGRLHRAVDALDALDRALQGEGGRSVGLGFVSRRRPPGAVPHPR
jgi:SAM-dependent methyltransferase